MSRDEIDKLWIALRPHLEWAQGFCLILLFARHPYAVTVLRKHLEDSLQLRMACTGDFNPSSTQEVEKLAEEILACRPGLGRGPLWVELWRHAEEAGWQEARRGLLHRLNERRFLLERDVRLPMVLVLPQAERSRFFLDAPDLWAVRSFTAELPIPPALEERPYEAVPGEQRVITATEPGPSEAEWTRLWESTTDKTRISPWDGFAAIESAAERGDLVAAHAIARQVLDLARALRQSLGDTPQMLRDLSVSLDNVGGLERVLGNPETARAAFQESFEIRQRLDDAS